MASSAMPAAVCVLLTACRIAASASVSLVSEAACFCEAMLSSIRATASSTILVSALRLRLAYSPRNQRPREVSMKASLIAA